MKKTLTWIAACALFLSGCGSAGGISAQTALPEPEQTGWQAVTTDVNAFRFGSSTEGPDFEYVLQQLDSIPLDQLIACSLTADGAYSEGIEDELRSRFLEAPNTVLTYLALMDNQTVDPNSGLTAAETVCWKIASADSVWYDGSEEFAQVLTACREAYPTGPVSALLEQMGK